MKKRFKQRKKHWFLIAYKFKTKDGDDGYGSRVASKEKMNISTSDFAKVYESLKSVNSSYWGFVVVSVSYLGHMTEKEFYDEKTENK